MAIIESNCLVDFLRYVYIFDCIEKLLYDMNACMNPEY